MCFYGWSTYPRGHVYIVVLYLIVSVVRYFDFLFRERDEELDAIILCAQALVRRFRQMNNSINEQRDMTTDTLQIASLLALFVSDHFGGSDKSASVVKARKSASGANCGKPFVCTCATGISFDTYKAIRQNVASVEDTTFLEICEKSLHLIKERHNSVIVPIGGLKFGVCRHRALLMKVHLVVSHVSLLLKHCFD